VRTAKEVLETRRLPTAPDEDEELDAPPPADKGAELNADGLDAVEEKRDTDAG
jgi:hypothetical protein